MKLVPIENIPKFYKSSKYQRLLDAFRNSSHKAVLVEMEDGDRPRVGWSRAAAINATIKSSRITGIRAMSRNDKVYLIKESDDE